MGILAPADIGEREVIRVPSGIPCSGDERRVGSAHSAGRAMRRTGKGGSYACYKRHEKNRPGEEWVHNCKPITKFRGRVEAGTRGGGNTSGAGRQGGWALCTSPSRMNHAVVCQEVSAEHAGWQRKPMRLLDRYQFDINSKRPLSNSTLQLPPRTRIPPGYHRRGDIQVTSLMGPVYDGCERNRLSAKAAGRTLNAPDKAAVARLARVAREGSWTKRETSETLSHSEHMAHCLLTRWVEGDAHRVCTARGAGVGARQ